MATCRYPIEDDLNGWRSSLRRTTRGWEGVRYAKVEAIDLADALTAPELPKIGDQWPNLPGCVVTEIGDVTKLGGDTGSSWLYIVPVRYETPTGSALVAAKYRKPGDAITEYFSTQESVTIYVSPLGITNGRFKIDSDGNLIVGTPIDTPINNGDGAAVPFAKLGARVSVWYDLNSPPNHATWINLAQPAAVNDRALTLPPRDFSIVRQPFNAYEVLLTGYAEQIEFVGKPELDGTPKPLLRVSYTLALARNHDVVWQSVDSAGAPTGDLYKDLVAKEADFTGLWPQ